jgi:hypothetical protein
MTRSSDGNHPIGSDENPMNIANVEVTGQRPKLPAIIPEFDFYLPPEGRPVVHEEENDEGGVGGGSGGPGSSSNDEEEDKDDDEEDEKSLTEMLFRNDSLPSDLENMLKQILIDCMGEKLYNELVSQGQLSITFDFGSGSSIFDENKITMNSFESNSLLHEMFHGAQYSRVSSKTWKSAGANFEVEASIAQYRYLEKQPDFASSSWARFYETEPLGINIARLSRFLSSNGSWIDSSQSLQFNSLFAGTGLMIVDLYRNNPILNQNGKNMIFFDANRSANSNIENLKYLSVKC